MNERKNDFAARKRQPSKFWVNFFTYVIVFCALGFLALLVVGWFKNNVMGPDPLPAPPVAEKHKSPPTPPSKSPEIPRPALPPSEQPVPVKPPPPPAVVADVPIVIDSPEAPAPVMPVVPPPAPQPPITAVVPPTVPPPPTPQAPFPTTGMTGGMEQPIQDPAELQRFKSDVQDRINDANGAEFPEDLKAQARRMVDDLQLLQKVHTLYFVRKLEIQNEDTQLEILRVLLGRTTVTSHLKTKSGAGFIVLGFADPTGTVQQNLALSKDRAKKVCDVVKEACPDVETVVSFGVGQTQLVGEDKKNRAVEVWLAVPR